MQRCIAPRLFRPSTSCPAPARCERLTTAPSVRIHVQGILGYPLQAPRAAVVPHARELGFDVLHARFHVDDGFGRVEEAAVARPMPSSASCLYYRRHVQSYPTSDRSFSLLSSAWLRSCCWSLATMGTGYWNASSHVWRVRGSGAAVDMPIVAEGGAWCWRKCHASVRHNPTTSRLVTLSTRNVVRT
jgi:hypothetical protein